LPVGTELDFSGLKARWFAYPDYPPDSALHHEKLIAAYAFKPNIIQRDSTMWFLEGKPAFLLDDPKGNTWIMQAWADIVDPNLTYDDLSTLGKTQTLTLPKGWTYRVATLPKTLELVAPDGKAIVTQDNLQNTYDKCSPGACSYKP